MEWRPNVIVLAQRDYENPTGAHSDFKKFLLGEGPSLEDLDLNRDRVPMRNTDL